MKKCLMLITILILISFVCPNIWAQEWRSSCGWEFIYRFDKNTIPIEILEWYDSDIISRKRPTYYCLQNRDIRNLPPEPEVDIVVLNHLNIDALTSVHIKKLRNWIRTGVDVSITGAASFKQLEFLFSFKGKEFISWAPKKIYLNKKCAINIDILEEKLEPDLSYIDVMTDLPYKTLVIIAADKYLNEAIMGVANYGKGRIFFNLAGHRGGQHVYTHSRLQLNLSQWLIGKDVPILTLKDIQEGFVLARIKLEDEQELFGKVSKSTDTHVRFENLKRKMTLPWKGIQWIEIKDENFRAKIPEFIPLYPKRD